MTITLRRCEHTAYSRFAQFHYTPDSDRCRVCRCYLALVDGKCVGFVAAMKSGPVWRAHKTVVTLPKDHPGYFTLWAAVADAQAELHLKEGHRFTVVAPADHAEYRDAPNSGWKITVRDARQRKRGNRSHEYVGLELAPIPAPIPDPTPESTGGSMISARKSKTRNLLPS